MSDYEDNDFNDGYGYGDGYSDGEQEDYFGEDGYFGDEFGMDDEDGFQAEYGVTDRTTLEEDPWYKRMSKVPEIFKNYKLPENILNLLRKQYKFKMPTTMYGAFVQGQLSTRERISKINTSNSGVIISNYISYSKLSDNFYFSNSEFINYLNPVALCLGYYIRNSDGTVDKTKLREIKQLLDKQNYTSVTLGNIFRYLRIWNRTFNVSPKSTTVQ